MTLTVTINIVVFLLLGFGVGLLHWIGLRRNVATYLSGGRLGPALALHAGRLALTIAVFVGAAQFGAVVILATLSGFLISRCVVAGGSLARDHRS